MSHRPDTVERSRRSVALDGWRWIAVLAPAVLVITAVAWAPPAHAQTEEPSPGIELGEDLYPPTEYPTDDSQGIVGIGRYDIGCATTG